MSKRAASALTVMVKLAGLVPTVSASLEVSAATKVAFSATVWVAAVVITGALSLRSVRLTVMVLGRAEERRVGSAGTSQRLLPQASVGVSKCGAETNESG